MLSYPWAFEWQIPDSEWMEPILDRNWFQSRALSNEWRWLFEGLRELFASILVSVDSRLKLLNQANKEEEGF